MQNVNQYYLLCRNEMSLATKIEFKKLCNVFEEIEKASSDKKAEVLEKFIQQCRIISLKLKAEFTVQFLYFLIEFQQQ